MEKNSILKINKGIKGSFRKSLNEIQLSADEGSFVRSSMICSEDKTLTKQSQTAAKVIVAEKENLPAVRRSKRKAVADKVTYAESPLMLKPPKSKNTRGKKTVTKSKKSCSVSSKKNEQKTISNQTKLNFSPVRTVPEKENVSSQSDNTEKCLPTSATVTDDDSGFDPASGIGGKNNNTEKCLPTSATVTDDDSGFDPVCGIGGENSPMNSTAILKTPHVKNSAVVPYDISVITADIPPLRYWKDLAEQRRIALERALHENELLHDELTVLEAENSRLKQLVKEAENLAEVVRAIVD